MAITKKSLCNGAMIKLGKRPSIANLENGTSAEERVFQSIFEKVIKIAIRKYRPNCCVSRATLSQDPNYVPRWEYHSGYKYPNNMLKLLEVHNDVWDKQLYPIEGEWILSFHKKAEPGESAESLDIKYLENKDVSFFDEDFANMCEWELAVAAAPVIDATREALTIAKCNAEADRWAADNAMENGFIVEDYNPLFDITEIVKA